MAKRQAKSGRGKRAKATRASRRRPSAPKRDADLLTRRVLADRLSVHMQTVTKWEREGLPIAERGAKGRPSYYRELEARAWLQTREEAAKRQPGAVDLVKERARKERAQAVLAEQAYLIRTRDLLPRDEVERVWSSEVAAVRTKLLSWATTLADQLHRASTIDGLPGIERVLQDAVRDVLRELADPDRALPDVTPPPGGEAAAA